MYRLLVIVYLQSVLTFFPWTHSFALKVLDLVLGPLDTMWRALVGYIPKLFFIAVLVVVTSYVIRFIRFLFREVDQGIIVLPGFHRDWAEPTFKIVRFLVIAFAAVVAFPYIPGSDSPAFKGVSIFIGVLFSLGSSSAIGNMVAGVILTYMRPFLIGDRVKIADTVGDVMEKNLLVTRIKTIKNVEITIPNSRSSAPHHQLQLPGQGTGADSPHHRDHRLRCPVAHRPRTAHRRGPGDGTCPSEPQPFVFQTALNDFYVSYEINAYTDQPNLMADIYSELHQNIQEKFNEAGVEIMSPHYTQLRDGNTVTIPESYRSSGYTPPSFRVRQTDER